MTCSSTPEIDTEDLLLPPTTRFRIWSRAQLEVEDAHVTLEGCHAGMMLELLRNRGRRVSSADLWKAAALGGGLPEDAENVDDAVLLHLRQMRYMLCAKGILLSVDDSDPRNGIMMSGLCRIETRPAPLPKKRGRSRKIQKRPTSEIQERQVQIPGMSTDSTDIPYSIPGRLERHGVPWARRTWGRK